MPSDSDPQLYRVHAIVRDTEGHNVEPSERFRDTYITGPDEQAACEGFREKCGKYGFEILENPTVEAISLGEIETLLAADTTDVGGTYTHSRQEQE